MTPEQQIKLVEERARLQIEAAERERDEALGLAIMAHLELMQALKYGFNPASAHSTLISIGRLSPMLKAKQEKHEQN